MRVKNQKVNSSSSTNNTSGQSTLLSATNAAAIANTVKVYPNPTTGTLTIELAPSVQTPADFMLYTVTGQVVYSKRLIDPENLLNLFEDGIKNGIYYYTISINNVNLSHNKLVIIK